MKSPPLTLSVIIAGIIALVLVVAIVVIPLLFGRSYFVIYLVNGEIYIGKASWFPRFHLTEAYLFQANPTPGSEDNGNFQLVPLSSTLWSPKKLYFEKGQIIFSGPIDEKSRVAETLRSR